MSANSAVGTPTDGRTPSIKWAAWPAGSPLTYRTLVRGAADERRLACEATCPSQRSPLGHDLSDPCIHGIEPCVHIGEAVPDEDVQALEGRFNRPDALIQTVQRDGALARFRRHQASV